MWEKIFSIQALISRGNSLLWTIKIYSIFMSSLNLNADSGILQVTWPLLTNQKLKHIVLFCCFSFWLDMRGHVTCRMPQSVIKKVVILNKWWWFFSNFLRVLSSQEGQYWAQNFTGHLLITYSNGFSCRKLSKKNLKWSIVEL